MKTLDNLLGNLLYCRAVLAFLAFLIYVPTFNHSFNMDDVMVTSGHRHTSKGLVGIPDILKSPYYEDEMGYSYEYRPITHITFAIEHEFFGGTACSGHAVNVLLYGITCLLILTILSLVCPPGMPIFPLLATTLFTLHPMHTEAVASIKNRDELLALFFSLMALWQGIRYGRSGGLWRLPLMVLLVLLSLLSKGSAASFLLLLPAAIMLWGKHIRRTIGVAVAISLVVMVYKYIMKWPLSWHEIQLTALFIMILGLIVMQLDLRKVGVAILGLLRPRWPDKTIRTGRLDVSSLVLGVVTLAVIAYATYSNNQGPLFVLASLVMVLPFFSGRFNLNRIFILFVGTLYPVVISKQYGLSYLLLALVVSAGGLDNRAGRVSVTVCAVLLSLSVIAHGVFFDPFFLFGQSEFSSLLTDAVFPLLPIGLLFSYRERLGSAGLLKRVFLTVAVISALGPGFSQRWEDAMMFIGVMSLYPTFFRTADWLRKAVSVVLSLLFIYSFGLWLGVFNWTQVQAPESGLLIHSEYVDQSVASASQADRPLAFLEYPLGIEAPLGERIGTASLVLGHYLVKMFIPWPQAFYYGYDEVPLGDWMNPLAVLSLLVHAVLLLLVFYFGRSHPILAFGILAYLSSMFLFSNFVATIPGMIGDRLTYVASFGFCVSLGYVLTLVYQRLFTAVAKGMFAVAVVTLMVVWSGMTKARAAKWKDPLTLMRHDISTVPNSAQAHNILASNLMQASFDPNTEEDLVEMRLEAIHHFRESLRIWPKTMNVWYDLGRAYMIVDDSERALLCFMSAYGLDSTFTYAAWNAAEIAQNLGRDSLAVEYYRHCIRFSPEMEEAYSRLSYIYLIRGEHEKSIAVNRLAIAREPSWRAPYDNMAQVFEAIEMPDSVEAYIRKRNAIGVP
jgi:hypothetical protein